MSPGVRTRPVYWPIRGQGCQQLTNQSRASVSVWGAALVKVGLGSFLHKPASSSPGGGQLASTRPGFFRSNQLEAGAGPDLVTSIYTHYRPVFISQGSHSVNEIRDKNPGKYKPFRLRDLSATAVCLTRADPLYLGLKAKLRNREVQKYSQVQISNMLKSQ